MKTIACEFGHGNRLKGIITLPTSGKQLATAVVMVSAGFNAKSGPHRMYSHLARSLADCGFATLRFDLGGVGASQTLNPGMPLRGRTLQDIQDALGFLQDQHGLNDFVVGGLCSGAEDGFHYADRDKRVKGVFLIDPHAYKTPMWSVRTMLSRRFLNRVILKALRVTGIAKLRHNDPVGGEVAMFDTDFINYRYSSHAVASQVLGNLLGRGVLLHYIYTGGRAAEFNHRSQFFKMFEDIDFADRLTLDFIPHIEHTQVFQQDREELVNIICQRLSGAYE